jgi:Uma2 family endonuclease
MSPEDTLTAMRKKAAEYRSFGVENIWLIDPEERVARRYAESDFEVVQTGELTVAGTPVRVVLSEMFAELDSGVIAVRFDPCPVNRRSPQDR